MNYHGFPNTDLYQEHELAGAESFWPSFTDIMMVIVMAFLLVTVSVILNNWQLVQSLKKSVAAEQESAIEAKQALQTIETKQQENETLEERQIRLEKHINQQSIQLSIANTTQQQTDILLQAKTNELAHTQVTLQNKDEVLKSINNQLNHQAQQVTSLKQSLSTQKEMVTSLTHQFQNEQLALSSLQNHSNEVTQQLKQTLAEVQGQLIQKNSTLDQLHLQLNQKTTETIQLEAALTQFKEKSKTGNEQLLSLQGDYDSLDEKYQKLLRPARSSKGKHITRVIYRKKGGSKVYRIQTAPNEKTKTVSKQQLHLLLADLKKKHANSLYVKVIIPSDSGLSYNEAWAFTSKMLNTYDYYTKKSK